MARNKAFKLSRKGSGFYTAIKGDFPNPNVTEDYIIQSLAKTLELASDASEEMDEKGAVQEYKNGARAVSPEWSILRNALNDARQTAKDLVALRKAIGSSENEKEVSKVSAKLATLMKARKAK